jgi:hypothetical protein
MGRKKAPLPARMSAAGHPHSIISPPCPYPHKERHRCHLHNQPAASHATPPPQGQTDPRHSRFIKGVSRQHWRAPSDPIIVHGDAELEPWRFYALWLVISPHQHRLLDVLECRTQTSAAVRVKAAQRAPCDSQLLGAAWPVYPAQECPAAAPGTALFLPLTGPGGAAAGVSGRSWSCCGLSPGGPQQLHLDLHNAASPDTQICALPSHCPVRRPSAVVCTRACPPPRPATSNPHGLTTHPPIHPGRVGT